MFFLHIPHHYRIFPSLFLGDKERWDRGPGHEVNPKSWTGSLHVPVPMILFCKKSNYQRIFYSRYIHLE